MIEVGPIVGILVGAIAVVFNRALAAFMLEYRWGIAEDARRDPTMLILFRAITILVGIIFFFIGVKEVLGS